MVQIEHADGWYWGVVIDGQRTMGITFKYRDRDYAYSEALRLERIWKETYQKKRSGSDLDCGIDCIG